MTVTKYYELLSNAELQDRLCAAERNSALMQEAAKRVSEYNGRIEHDRDQLRAKLAEFEGQEPTIYQVRMRATWSDESKNPWCDWEDCSKERYNEIIKVPLLHDWEYEGRKLYAHPLPTQQVSAELVGEITAAHSGDGQFFNVDWIDHRKFKVGDKLYLHPPQAAIPDCVAKVCKAWDEHVKAVEIYNTERNRMVERQKWDEWGGDVNIEYQAMNETGNNYHRLVKEMISECSAMLSAAPTQQAAIPDGFDREDLEATVDGLLAGYEQKIGIGNVTGCGEEYLESTTAYAARFIQTMLSAAPSPVEPDHIVDVNKKVHSSPDYKAQRDELLTALNGFVRTYEQCGKHPDTSSELELMDAVHEDAKKIIEKVEIKS